MAINSILLPIGAATLPDGSASNAAPAIQRVKSSAAAPTPHILEAAFDGATSEMLSWAFRMPSDYVSGPVLKVQFKPNGATPSGNAVFDGRLAAYTPATDTTSLHAKAFAAANNSGAVSVGTVQYALREASITLTNADSLAANDFVILHLARLPADANDTYAADVGVVAVTLEYTA